MEGIFSSELKLFKRLCAGFLPFGLDKGGKKTKHGGIKNSYNKSPFPPFLFLLLLFLMSPIIVSWEELTPIQSPISEKNVLHCPEPGVLSLLGRYVWQREVWGFIDEVHFIEEQTGEVTAHRVGNRFLLRTPFGGFLWEYQRAYGQAALFPRRNNVFGGRLHKQDYQSGSQDKRRYGYYIDTDKFKRWLENGAYNPLAKLPADIKGHFIYTDSDAEVGNKLRVDHASERFDAIQSELSAHVNRGRWYGLGLDFLYIRYNPRTFGKFSVVDQKEVIDRDIWRGRLTLPIFENFHISGLYEEDHDTHKFVNTNVPSLFGIPALLVSDRTMHPTQRKYGPESKYFFGEDLHKAVSVGFSRYDGDSAGRLAEFGLKRAFRIDSAGQFANLDLHNSFGLLIGYEEYYKREDRNAEKEKKWGVILEAGYLDSDEVSGKFSGTVFRTTAPLGATTAVWQFDEDLKQLFFKGNFSYHFDPRGEKPHPLAGEFNADFSFWNIEREGKQTQEFPLIGVSDVIRSFRDDRRILQLGISYELDKPRHRFGGVYSIGMDFNWDIKNSDKVGGINVGFFY